MKRLLIAILTCYSFACFSQAYTNIVPDSSFEILNTGCGTLFNLSQMDLAPAYWKKGNEGSTDIYYGCYLGPPINAYYEDYPSNIGGYQYPRTGGAFTGIFTTDRPNRNISYREYLQTQLLIPLEAGKKYYAGCHVSLGENYKMFSVNNFGLLFSDSIPAYDSSYYFGSWMQWGPIRQEPQVMNDTTFNLSDTLGWILVADTFIAQGGERWLTIGNFRDDAHSIIVPTGYNTLTDSGSYYFVDDVFLYCLDSGAGPIPPIAKFQPFAPAYCLMDTIQLSNLSAGFPDTYIWSMPGALVSSSTQQNPIAIYPNAGTYTVQLIVTKNNGTSDTTQRTITINPLPTVSIGTPNNTVCSGWHTQITASGANSYVWSMGGATSPTRNVSPTITTTYSVIGTNTITGCANSDSITITVIQGPTFNLFADTICNNQSAITLNAQPPAGTYSGPGITGNQFDPQTTGNGTYQLIYTYTNSSLPDCIGTDTAYITVNDCPIGLAEIGIVQDIKIYPNPARDKIIIDLGARQKGFYEIKILDLLGKEIKGISIDQSNFQVDITEFASGMYYLRINNIIVQKLIVEH